MSSVLVVGGTAAIGLEIARYYADDRSPRHADRPRCRPGGGRGQGGRRRYHRPRARPGRAAETSLPPWPGSAPWTVWSWPRSSATPTPWPTTTSTGRVRLVTLKLVGYTEVVHALRSRIAPDGAIVLFGGLAKDRPYPGSTTVSTVNGGITGLLHTLVVELAPIRVNAIHPGIVGDSPYWRDRDLGPVIARTPCGQLARMADIVDAVAFLLGNPAVNGVEPQRRRRHSAARLRRSARLRPSGPRPAGLTAPRPTAWTAARPRPGRTARRRDSRCPGWRRPGAA